MWRRLIPLVVVVGCSDDTDPLVLPDASATADATSNACLVKDSYGAVGAVTGTATNGPNTLSATIDAGPPRDAFFINLKTGKGVFAFGLTPGDYTISGAEAGYTTCGLCVNIIADIVAGSGPSKFYLADSGTVKLTATGPVIGTAQNLHFVEVDATGTGAPVPGGCSTTIESISFSQ